MKKNSPTAGSSRTPPPSNFGGNVRIGARHFFTPRSEAEVIEILERFPSQSIRVIGRLHSWSELIQCEGVVLDLRCLDDVSVEQDGAHIGAGCQIKRALVELKRRGKTLPSVGFIAEQSIAGAIATGTHGSGRHSLSHYVTQVRIARYDSQSGKAVIQDIDGGDMLLGLKCSLGCLGVILRVTMQCREEYLVEEVFGKYRSLEQVLSQEDIYPIQQFYWIPWRWDYIAQHRRENKVRKSRLATIYRWYRLAVFDVGMHVLIFAATRWLKSFTFAKFLYKRVLPGFVIGGWRVTMDSSAQLVMKHDLFCHIETELFVRREQLSAALTFLRELMETLGSPQSEGSTTFRQQLADADMLRVWQASRGTYCHHYPICVRKILADETLISMASNSDSDPKASASEEPDSLQESAAWYSVSLISYQHRDQRESFQRFATLAAKCVAAHFGGRLHWGKYYPLSVTETWQCYPGMERFCEVQHTLDPDGRFLNVWTSQLLNAPSDSQADPAEHR